MARVYSYYSNSAIGDYLQIDNFRSITLVLLARAGENFHGPYNAHRRELPENKRRNSTRVYGPITFVPFVLVGEKSYNAIKEKQT